MKHNHVVFFVFAVLFFMAGICKAEGEICIARPAKRIVTLTGFTRARAEMQLVSENAGRVETITADIGEAVGKDGVFMCLDAEFTELDLRSNAVERSRLKSEIGYYEKEAKRYRELVKRDTAAQSALDKLEQDLDRSKHQLDAARVQRNILREKLDRSCVKAPAGWKVTERRIEPGQWVNAGEVVATVGDYTRLIVPFSLAPDEYEHMQAGGPITLTLPDKDIFVPAEIYRENPAFDPVTRKISVELAVDKNTNTGLSDMRGGLRAELSIAVPDESGAVLVPKSAVIERYEEHYILRDNGERVKVVVLGPGPADTLRVAADDVCPGERFQRKNGQAPASGEPETRIGG